MAKNFDAQIQVKDKNSISTLQKIIKETEKLKKDMASIGAKPIQMKVKEDATFKKAQDDIKKLSNTRVNPIQLKVNDSLTILMNKLEGSIGNTFREINGQVAALAPKLAALNAASTGAGAGLLGGAAAGRLLGGKGNGSKGNGFGFHLPSFKLPNLDNVGNMLKGWGLSVASWIGNNGSKIAQGGANLSWKFYNGFKKGLGTVASKSGGILKPFVDAMDKNSPFMKMGDMQDSYFSQMIEKQKAKIQKLNDAFKRMAGFTRNEHLPQYQTEMIHTGPDDYETMLRRVTPNAFEKIKNGAKSAGSAIKQIFTGNGASVFRSALASIQTNFHALTSSAGFFGRNLRASFSSLPAFSNTIRTIGTRMAMFGQRGLFAGVHTAITPLAYLSRGLMAIPSLAGAAFARVAPLGIRAFSSIARFGGAAFRTVAPALGMAFRGATVIGGAAFKGIASIGKAALKGVGSVFSGLGSLLKSALSSAFKLAATAGKAALMAAVAAVGVGIHDMAEQESNQVSMKHFIKNGNAGMSEEDAQKENDKYMGQLTKLGVDTPFANADIYAAGRRAVQVSDGNTTDAYNLTTMASDMAALNPGKTVQDAMEAMADLKNGETERMKEFGFKISQDDLKKMVRGSASKAPLSTDETTKAFKMLTSGDGKIGKTFAGGAKELSSTLSGKFSTLTGGFRQMMVEAIQPFSDSMKFTIDKRIESIDDIGKKLKAATTKTAAFIKDLYAGDSTNFPIIKNLINSFNILNDAVSPIVDKVSAQFDRIKSSAKGSFGNVGQIIENVSQAIADRINALGPVFDLLEPTFESIKQAAIACWPVIQGVVRIGAKVIKDVVGWLKPVIESVGSVFESIGKIVADVWPNIETTIMKCWDNLQPVFSLLKTAASEVADFFRANWPEISTTIKTAWDIIGPILEAFCGALGDIANDTEWALKKLKEWALWMEGNADKFKKAEDAGMVNPYSPQATKDQFTYHGAYDGGSAGSWGGEQKEDGSNAFGLDRVPYNGYKSILHEGERVLTARQAREQDSNSSATPAVVTVPITINDARDPDKVVRLMVSELQKVLGNFSPA